MYTGLKMGLLLVLVVGSLGACVGRGRDWPSLMTPEEQRTGKPSASVPAGPTAEAAPQAVVAAPQPPAETVAPTADANPAAAALMRAQIARLNEAKRDADYISDRWQKQRTMLAQSVAGIKVKGPADSGWNKAQLELTRLNQIAAEWDDLMTVANDIAGQCAVAAHGGAAVAATISDVGALLADIAKAKQDTNASIAAFRRQISSK